MTYPIRREIEPCSSVGEFVVVEHIGACAEPAAKTAVSSPRGAQKQLRCRRLSDPQRVRVSIRFAVVTLAI